MLLGLSIACKDSSKKQTSPAVQQSSSINDTILVVHDGHIKSSAIDTVIHHIQNAFPYPVKKHAAVHVPDYCKSGIHPGRYRADSILVYLRKEFGSSCSKVILFTHYDITCTKRDPKTKKIKSPEWKYKDWAIFGLGSCPGKACVVSDFRLHARNANEETYLRRFYHVAIHELGHTYGLPHCPSPKCIMNDANETIVTVDQSTGQFCASCKSKLAANS
jgi:archaemetzincin